MRVPGIHVGRWSPNPQAVPSLATWMAGTSPAMTVTPPKRCAPQNIASSSAIMAPLPALMEPHRAATSGRSFSMKKRAVTILAS